MAGLRDRGVVFEEYDFPGLKTVNGIADAGPRALRGSRTAKATSSASSSSSNLEKDIRELRTAVGLEEKESTSKNEESKAT